MNEISVINEETIKNKIYSIQRLNEQVKRNIDRFPNEFMFQLTKYELENYLFLLE